jgi:hypothetical protein
MAEKQSFGVLENVVLAYAKLGEPTKKFQSEDLVYEVDCIVEKSVAKAWSKQFVKQKAKEFDADEFKAKFKMEPPFGGDEVYVIKMRKAASKDGEFYDQKFRPQVLLDTAEGERVNITTSRLISNGSRAKVSYRITENSFGIFGMLNNVLMDEDGFVEYVSQGGGPAGNEFGGSKPIKQEASRKEVTEARKSKEAAEKKPAKKVIKEEDTEEMDDSPFN